MELNPPKSSKNGHSSAQRRKGVGPGVNHKRAPGAGTRENAPATAAPKGPVEKVDFRTLLQAIRAAQRGDFSVRLNEDNGDPLSDKVAEAFNLLMEKNEGLTHEIIRIGRVVGREGRMMERAIVPDAKGSWARKIEALNALIADLVQPTTEIARVIGAVAAGDFTQKMNLAIEGSAVKGEFLRIGKTVNGMVDQLSSFAAEVTRVAKDVGTEGKLGGQAEVPGVSGVWKDLTENVNSLANNLTAQVRNVAEVTTSVAQGDLSKKITVDAKGEVLALKNTINTMVDQLNSFASEVRRVAREVGTDGKLGGQADVKGVSGVWRDLTDNVNLMASNLTNQVRGIVKVVTAVANGDLSQRFKIDAKGEIAALADTINNMTDTLRAFAAEVTRVAREVGTEGKLGGQAQVPGVSGTWRDLTDNVNMLAGNLTNQVRNIALVTTAVVNGDLSQKITVDVRGEVLELKNTINTMVDQLRAFAAEVTRIAKEVGTEGKLGAQADIKGVAGTWKDLTDNVNLLAGNLTSQVRNIALVTTAVANGDLSKKITVDAKGEILELKNTINVMVDQLRAFAAEVTRVAREVGAEGKLGGQAQVPGVAGTWKDLTDNVNFMASNLTNQVRGIVKVVTAVANGDLSQKFVVEAKGEIAALADTINNMTGTLRTFAEQVTTVAREVGTEGKLGGQAKVPGAAGTWRDLTDNVNMLAGNLTNQVRNIAAVTTAVATGDLSQKITVDAKGEILELKNTINAMVEQLRTFAREVTRVAREVGTEGKLGGQAKVPGVAGTWQDLTENVNLMANNLTNQVRGIVKVVTAVAEGDLSQKLVVEAKGEIAALADTINNMTGTRRVFADKVNQLAATLTTQVRAISEVATAVTKGDLTRTIDVEAQGEVLSLKDTINQMIANLKDTTHTNKEQDWLKTNLAKFSQMMQGQRSLESLAELIMSELTPLVTGQHGTFFVTEPEQPQAKPALRLLSSYAFSHRKLLSNRYQFGEGLVGQCALEKKTILVDDVPEDYIRISSSVGEAGPRNILVLPVLFEGQIKGVIELASFQRFNPIHITFLEQLMLSIGVVFNMITASMRTEELLEELKGSNVELEKRTDELEEKASLLEEKNREIAQASASLEEKAKQLALVSKYKSEFLANMSHELRTPLNSLLILAKLLAENEDQTLTSKQVEYAKTINSAGHDLLALISQILDLSKIEAGKLQIETKQVSLADVRDFVEGTFRQVAEQKGLGFSVQVAPEAPGAITTDSQRLQQILKNLLSNGFKFTEKGRVELRVELAPSGTAFKSDSLKRAGSVVAFSVSDSGIGIPEDKQQLIFEAFQQADASTSRMYGGTGLGLTISRELAQLLGGEIAVKSTPGAGSTFTLYLPLINPDLESSYREASEREISNQPPVPELTIPVEAMTELAGKTVLLVDDDARNLFAVTSLLERGKMKVLPAVTAQEGIEVLEANSPVDLVLMDIMLPGMDGFQLTRKIRSMDAYRKLPIIALTAKAMPGDREKCLEAGCSDFIPKPVNTERLITAMRRGLGL